MRPLPRQSIVDILLLFIIVVSHRILNINIIGTTLLLGKFVLLLIIIHDWRIIQFSLLMLIRAVCSGAHTVEISQEVVLLVLVHLSLRTTQSLLGLYHSFYK